MVRADVTLDLSRALNSCSHRQGHPVRPRSHGDVLDIRSNGATAVVGITVTLLIECILREFY